MCVCVGKYIISYAILPAQFLEPRRLPTDYQTFLQTGRLQRGNLVGENISVPSPEGHTLDGCQVLYPGSRKWIINFHGAGAFYEAAMDFMFDMAGRYQANVADINYRHTRRSSGSNPSCFQDIVNDGKALVEHLLARGVRREDIVIIGHSLGGAVGLAVAREYQFPILALNTFSSTMAVVPYLVSPQMAAHVNNMVIPPPIDLPFRVAYFVFSFLEYLVTCEITNALLQLIEVVKTLFLGTLLILMWLWAPTEWSNCVRHEMHSQDGNLLISLCRSPRFQWLALHLLYSTGWNVDNVAAWNAISARKLAFFAPNDEVIPLPASLSRHIEPEHTIRLSDQANHSTLGHNTTDYQRFLLDVLRE